MKSSQYSNNKLTSKALAGLDLSVRSTSEPQNPAGATMGFTSVIDELFAQATAARTKPADTTLERALETLSSNDFLLKKKQKLYQSIREANQRAAEGSLYQLYHFST